MEEHSDLKDRNPVLPNAGIVGQESTSDYFWLIKAFALLSVSIFVNSAFGVFLYYLRQKGDCSGLLPYLFVFTYPRVCSLNIRFFTSFIISQNIVPGFSTLYAYISFPSCIIFYFVSGNYLHELAFFLVYFNIVSIYVALTERFSYRYHCENASRSQDASNDSTDSQVAIEAE